MSDYLPTPRKERQPDPFLGGAMMAVGALVVALFGTCTWATLDSAKSGLAWGFVLVWAAIALGGLVLIRAGWRVLRGDRDRDGGEDA